MKVLLPAFILINGMIQAQPFSREEISRWEAQAKQITITRDKWGIAHINGMTDADAVFGMLYAQCEDDFPRVERNYLTATARRAEADGEEFLYHDLRQRLYLDTVQAIAAYEGSPDWLKKICQGFSDGVNYYLHRHQETRPKLLRRFQPWFPLMFSEGSIGGDIEDISLRDLKRFYDKATGASREGGSDDRHGDDEPGGSNGIAIAPSRSANGNALFLINPHTSFYFRSELQVTSKEGLNAYGAVTWGQFFVYQGFNEHCGWMHTSSEADVIDIYRETIIRKGSKYLYQFGKEQRPVTLRKITVKYKTTGGLAKRDFTGYFMHHGPVVGEEGGKWITTRIMVEPSKALQQSFLRTKAGGFDDFRKVMDMRTNSSNNTVFADDKGNIAYWHGNFMPMRDPSLNYNDLIDGTNPAADWNGLHAVDETVHVYNPADGWIQNCNSTPFTASGASSPDPKMYPSYMAPEAENARGLHAIRVLKDEPNFTVEKLIAAAYDPYLPSFEILLPPLLESFDKAAASNDTLRAKYSEAIQLLKKWDYKWSATSVPTTLAIEWAQRLREAVDSRIPDGSGQLAVINFLAGSTTTNERMKALAVALAVLQRDFGSWRQAWGGINRLQRLNGNIDPVFDDNSPSIPVAFTSATWGSLASYDAKRYPNTKRMYGRSGNSFVAVVEFGRKVRAKSIVTGGSSGNPSSKHFIDQSQMYAAGQFKDVLFYPEDYRRNAERTYHPGEK